MNVFELFFMATYAAVGFVVGSVCHALRGIKANHAPDANAQVPGASRPLLVEFLFWPLAICVLVMRIAALGIRHTTRATGIDKHLVEL